MNFETKPDIPEERKQKSRNQNIGFQNTEEEYDENLAGIYIDTV